jgi:hypothetical protein
MKKYCVILIIIFFIIASILLIKMGNDINKNNLGQALLHGVCSIWNYLNLMLTVILMLHTSPPKAIINNYKP